MCTLPLESAVHSNAAIRGLYNAIGNFLPASLCWLDFLITGFIVVFMLVNMFLGATALYQWMERRLLGRFQSRIGPNRWGPYGLGTAIADVLKLLLKEDVMPRASDRLLAVAAPIMTSAPLFLLVAVIPFGRGTFLTDLNVGILYLFAIAGFGTLGVLVAGWASGNKYATLGAMRGVAQLISYEIPIVTAALSIVLMATTMAPADATLSPLSLVGLVEYQRIPFLLLQPLPFFILMVGLSAEMNRPPFDIVEAESELVAGYATEYGGIRFALLFIVDFALVLIWSGVLATVFLQGYRGPVLPSHLWFFLKMMGFVFLFIWLRATLPRLRVDQIMRFTWKYLLPLAFANLMITAVEAYLFPSPTTAQLWGMVVVNWIIAVALLLGWAAVLQSKRPLIAGLRIRHAGARTSGPSTLREA